jgi:hypothetical protein
MGGKLDPFFKKIWTMKLLLLVFLNHNGTVYKQVLVDKKVKLARYRPGEALGGPGG